MIKVTIQFPDDVKTWWDNIPEDNLYKTEFDSIEDWIASLAITQVEETITGSKAQETRQTEKDSEKYKGTKATIIK